MTDLVDALNRQFACPGCHASVRWRGVARPDRRQRSILQRMACMECGLAVFAKLPRSAKGADDVRQQARLEFEGLSELARVFPRSETCATLVPLGLVECVDGAIIVTQACDGVDLLRRLRAGDVEDARGLLRAAGTLLRSLHDCSPRGVGLQPLEVDERLEFLAQTYGAALQDAGARRACAVLTERAGDLRGQPVRSSWSHGDFKPENVLVDGHRCILLDTHLRHTGAIVYDLAAFLDHVWLAGETRGGGALRALGTEAATELLDGYGQLDEGEGRALRWAQLYFMLCYLGRARQRGLFARIFEGRRMARLLERLVAAA